MEITQSLLRALLDYNPDTGVFVWRECNGRRRDLDGRIAGFQNKSGYLIIGVLGKPYMAHRLAWLYMMGSWPEAHIDHINMVKADNRWGNLRAATKSENGANSVARGRSGLKGAYYNAKCNCWYSRLKKRYLGAFPTAEAAHQAFVKAAAEEYGEFARG